MSESINKDRVIKDLLQMQEKTAHCNGLVADMIAQSWVIELLGEKIKEYGGNPYVLKTGENGTLQMIREPIPAQDSEKDTADVPAEENVDSQYISEIEQIAARHTVSQSDGYSQIMRICDAMKYGYQRK